MHQRRSAGEPKEGREREKGGEVGVFCHSWGRRKGEESIVLWEVLRKKRGEQAFVASPPLERRWEGGRKPLSSIPMLEKIVGESKFIEKKKREGLNFISRVQRGGEKKELALIQHLSWEGRGCRQDLKGKEGNIPGRGEEKRLL